MLSLAEVEALVIPFEVSDDEENFFFLFFGPFRCFPFFRRFLCHITIMARGFAVFVFVH